MPTTPNFTHEELIDTFFPKIGVPWGAHRDSPQDKAGVYVFSTFPGPLKDNDYGLYGGQSGDPEQDYRRLTEMIGAGHEIVLYVGRTESRSIADRLRDYERGTGGANRVLVRLLKNPATPVYVRWTAAVHFETALIRRLKPSCNGRNISGKLVFPPMGTVRWEGRRTWQSIRHAGARALPELPGIYVWTNLAANVRMNTAGVYYVGESMNLRARFGGYLASYANMNASLARTIRAVGSKNIFVRWTRHALFESEIIVGLDAWLNVKGL